MFVQGPMFTQSEATAAQRTFTFFAVDVTDGITPELTLDYEDAAADVQVSKNGGAFANAAGVVTEVAVGIYQFVAAAADIDTLGEALFKFVDAAARTVHVRCQVVALDLNTALTAATIADAVCDEALSGHTTDGSVGEALGFVEAMDTAIDGLSTSRVKTRPISMAAAAGDFIFDGADTGLGYDIEQALSGKVTVSGTWDSATATLQSCVDPQAAVPSWVTHGTPLTADGTITITAPIRAIRLVTSGGGGTTALVATALVVEPRS